MSDQFMGFMIAPKKSGDKDAHNNSRFDLYNSQALQSARWGIAAVMALNFTPMLALLPESIRGAETVVLKSIFLWSMGALLGVVLYLINYLNSSVLTAYFGENLIKYGKASTHLRWAGIFVFVWAMWQFMWGILVLLRIL